MYCTRKNIHRRTADEACDKAVRGIPVQLERGGHLLDNAITCSPRSGQVWLEVHLSDDDDQVQVDVVDAGPCIPKRYLPHVFDDYFQVQRKQFVPGAGLGLSTARKIVELHRGQIWVVSPCFEGGVGSRFSFVLLCSLPDRPRKEEIGGDDHS